MKYHLILTMLTHRSGHLVLNGNVLAQLLFLLIPHIGISETVCVDWTHGDVLITNALSCVDIAYCILHIAYMYTESHRPHLVCAVI